MLGEKSVRIFEDDVFLAMGISDVVKGSEGTPLGPFATALEVLDYLNTHEIAAAVIDCDLADCEITIIVGKLAEKTVPVVIYAARDCFPEAARVLANGAVLRKPINPEMLVLRLAEELARRNGYLRRALSLNCTRGSRVPAVDPDRPAAFRRTDLALAQGYYALAKAAPSSAAGGRRSSHHLGRKPYSQPA